MDAKKEDDRRLTASSPEITRSFSVPVATTPPSLTPELLSLSLPLLLFFNLNLYVGRASIDSGVAPLVWVASSLKPRMEIIQGRQQQIVAHKMKGIAYPIQLKIRNTTHNLQREKMQKWYVLSQKKKLKCLKVIDTTGPYRYKLGASSADECPPKSHTLPTTNQTAKKQSKAILKYSTSPLILINKNKLICKEKN